jgi:hypothetical protein
VQPDYCTAYLKVFVDMRQHISAGHATDITPECGNQVAVRKGVRFRLVAIASTMLNSTVDLSMLAGLFWGAGAAVLRAYGQLI